MKAPCQDCFYFSRSAAKHPDCGGVIWLKRGECLLNWSKPKIVFENESCKNSKIDPKKLI